MLENIHFIGNSKGTSRRNVVKIIIVNYLTILYKLAKGSIIKLMMDMLYYKVGGIIFV